MAKDYIIDQFQTGFLPLISAPGYACQLLGMITDETLKPDIPLRHLDLKDQVIAQVFKAHHFLSHLLPVFIGSITCRAIRIPITTSTISPMA